MQVPAGREVHEKREILRRLLRDAKDLQNALIFCNRKREVAVVYKSLQKHGFSVGALHGDMDQSARTAALDQFRKGEIPLLVASDVAARGLDIPTVSHVFNFDVPHHADDYVHRIGRTGRAGRTGTAISIVTPLDSKSIAAIERLIGQTIPRAEGDYSVSVGSDRRYRPAARTARKGRFARRLQAPRQREGRSCAERQAHPARPQAASRASASRVSGEREARHGDEREARHGEREPRHAKGAGRNAGPQPQASDRGIHAAGPRAGLTRAFDRPSRAAARPARGRIGARRSLASAGIPAAPGSRPRLDA